MSSATAWTVGTTNYTYDTAGRLTGITNPNGTSSALTYDNADRLTSQADTAQPWWIGDNYAAVAS